MQHQMIDNENMICFWLTSEEDADAELRDVLLQQIEAYHKARYTVVVFVSGAGDLFTDTLALLRHNRALPLQEAPEA